VARWRRAHEATVASRLSSRANQLVIPLVIGDRSALPPDLGAAFRAAGLVHLLALSGLHVVWLAALARGLCALAGGGVRARALAGALCALGYAGIAGPLPSLLRAAATELLVAAARFRDRALDPLQALALGAMALLVVAPGWCADLGFQLSCAATLGLVTVGPPLLERCGRARALVAPLVPTAAAQVPATPLLIARFHALSWTGGLANLVAVPVAGLLLAAAWIGALCDLALPGLGALWFQACEVLAAVFRAIADFAGARPGAMPATGAEPWVAAVAALGGALLAIALPGPRTLDARGARFTRGREAAMLLGGIATGLAIAIAASVRPLAPPPGKFWLVALDVGQGDAIALGFPDGWWLVDAGPRSPRDDAGERVVVPFLRWAGVRRLDTLVLTHDDGDHVGGVDAVRRALAVKRILASPSFPGVPGPGPRFGARAVARGDTLCRDPVVAVLWPPGRGAPRGLTSADNAAGVVLSVGAGAGRALLMADVDSTVEESLAVAPGVAIVKLGHHGSASSSGTAFLVRAAPELGLLSVGRHNPFGHPSPAVIARLARARIPVARTDRSGALWFELSEDGVRAVDWRAGADREPAIAAAPRARVATSRPPFP
jgi:competence protein ComEC